MSSTFSIPVSHRIPSLSSRWQWSPLSPFYTSVFFPNISVLGSWCCARTFICQDSFNSNSSSKCQNHLCCALKLGLLQHCILSILSIPLVGYEGKLPAQLKAGARGRCLWRPAVRPGLAADWAELSSLPPVYFFKWQKASLYFLVRLVKLMSGNDLYWFDRLAHAHRSALTTESCLITTKRRRISGNLKDLSQRICE